jgi:hypothetical protein
LRTGVCHTRNPTTAGHWVMLNTRDYVIMWHMLVHDSSLAGRRVRPLRVFVRHVAPYLGKARTSGGSFQLEMGPLFLLGRYNLGESSGRETTPRTCNRLTCWGGVMGALVPITPDSTKCPCLLILYVIISQIISTILYLGIKNKLGYRIF